MKNLLIIILLIALLPFFNFAQNSGTIIYEETIEMTINLPEDMDEEMKKMIPTSQTSSLALYFTETESVYTNYEAADDEDNSFTSASDDESTVVKVAIMRPENITYCNYKDKTLVESKDFMGKKFLIKGKIEPQEWKITGEQKQIGKYICQEAVYQKDSTIIVAYFTPQIPISVGPESYNGLPGAILEVIFNDGERVIIAKDVRLGDVPADKILAPTKGKKVTLDEYEKIVEKRAKEMGAGDGTQTTIEIRMN